MINENWYDVDLIRIYSKKWRKGIHSQKLTLIKLTNKELNTLVKYAVEKRYGEDNSEKSFDKSLDEKLGIVMNLTSEDELTIKIED